MANEFIIKNGFHSKGNSQVTGSLDVTEGITGSFSGDGSGITGTVTSASYAITASHALNAGGGGSTFPFVGDAVITGSLTISGSFNAFTLDADNIVLGPNAGTSMQAGADNNVVLGNSAASNLTTGDNNVIIGTNAGDGLSTGASNVAIGRNAGFSSIGFRSVLVGDQAGTEGGTDNVFLGYQAGAVGTGNYNVAIGMTALRGNSGGSNYNIAIGYEAGYGVGAGDENILVGMNAGRSILTGNANIIIGSGSLGASALERQLRIGHADTIVISGSLDTGDIIFASTASAEYLSTPAGNLSSISASYALTASHALNAGGGGSTFPFSGSAVITGSLIIEDTSTSELFRVTQKGTGDAIRIEDTTNPDSTPTVVTATGDILIGTGSGAGGNTKLYVKEGDAGSLALGTGNTVIVESDTTNYIAMVAPDANLSGMVMGSPSDGFGAFIRWGLDTQRVQIGAARTNHSIEFTVGNKGATSMQLTPDTTGTSNYNATLTVTGSLVVSGSTQINTTAGILYDESSVDSIRYIQRGLFSSNGALSVQYDTRKLYRNDGTTISYDWENAEINDDGGTLAIDLGERKLHDRFGTEIGSFTTTGTAYLSGSLIGTASYANNATSASYAISASHLIGGGGGSDPAININANGTTLTEVTSDSDLPTTLAANTTYLIRGNVATGKTLNVTNEGTSVIGIGRNQSHLSYTGSNELFNVHDQSFSIKSLTMKSSGSIMTAKNVSPGAPYNDGRTKVLDIKDCQVKNTNDVMEVHGFELVDLNNVLFWYITGSQGLSFQSVRHLEISSCEFYNWYDEVATGSFAPSGTKMVEIRPNTGSVNTPVVNINSSIFHPEQGQIGLYIDSGSETLFGTVASNTFIDVNGGTLLAGSNYDSGSMLKYDIGINQGLEDSKAYLYGYQNGTDAQGATTSYTQLSIASFSTNIETRMSASTAGITYIGTKPIDVMFQINVGVNDVGGNNEQFDFALYKNTNIINGSERRIELDSGEEGNIVTFALTNIVQNDLLTVYYKSPTNDNFTLQNFSIIIKE